MTDSELCVWLNGIESLSAEILAGIGEERDPLSILSWFQKDEVISERAVEKLRVLNAKGWFYDEIERAYRSEITIVTWFDERYPARLRTIANPPLLLYVKGKLPDFEHSVSVVGTRRCTPYGFKVAEMIGAALAQAGQVVVSGGARGIDGAVHGGALGQNGITVPIFGTGVDVCWPAEHDKLYENILSKGGALISEFIIGAPGRQWRFPRRNRIIAGLTDTLIVVESPFKSGAMITAKMAMEMGRNVWVVPGRIDEKVCQGSNQLLIDGASALVNVEDFVDHLCHFGQLPLFTPVELTDEQRKVFDCLQDRGDLTTDQLAARTGLAPGTLMQTLTELQLQSLIYSTGGGRWRANPR